MQESRITVIGSLNMDLVVHCHTFPKPGETISAIGYRQVPGGKGANQAVSAALACEGLTDDTGSVVRVGMIGRIGDDDFGNSLLKAVESRGVLIDGVESVPACESGLAFITVQQDGQNSIAIIAGANAKLTPADMEANRDIIASSKLILLQLEVPMAAVEAAIRIAQESNVPILLDPAPIPLHLPESLFSVDILTPNEHEASALAGMPIRSMDEVKTAAEVLHSKGVKTVVITMGHNGAYLSDQHGGRHIPPYHCEAIDTTAAGDAFAGAMAVRFVETGDIDEAVKWGNAAGAIAASRMGAQPSMGTREEINQLWSKQ